MSFIHSIQSMLPRPENRSREEIARDVEDELAFHLEMRTRAIEAEEGVDRVAAGERARARFGDVDRIRNECQRIALKERSMLQRVNFVMMLVVLVMVAIVGWQVLRTQAKTAAVLSGISSDLARMKFEDQKAASNSAAPPLVYLDGDVERPGVYNLPSNGLLTLSRMLTAAGVVKDRDAFKVMVSASDTDGKSIVRYINEKYTLTNDLKSDYVLGPNDRVVVTATNSASVGNSATEPAARVLVEGDVAGVGWHTIDMNRGTSASDLLERVGATDDVWVLYRRTGSDSAPWGVPISAFRASSGRMVLRPGDELRLVSDANMDAARKRSYWFNRWLQDGIGTWSQVDDAGLPVQDGWTLQASDEPNPMPRAGRQLSVQLTRVGATPTELSVNINDGNSYVMSNQPLSNVHSMQWGVERGMLVLDASTLKVQHSGEQPQGPDIDLKRVPGLQGRIIFTQTTPSDRIASTDPRVAAVGDFVVRLFALADPADPNLDQTIRDFLDAEEKTVDAKYPDDPATAGMIKELIAARRKIFDADAGFRAAATAEQREKAVTEFLNDMLTKADADGEVVPAELLDAASQRVDQLAGGDAELAATMRERIRQARSTIEQPSSPPTSAPAGGMSDAELQKFIPRLMTASIPNSAASSLPTLDELNRAAASIDVAYAKEPTLLAKLHGMVDTVRARLNAGSPTDAPATRPGQ